MTRPRHRIRIAALAAVSLLLAGAATAKAQGSSPGFLNNLFSRGEPPSQQHPADQPRVEQPRLAQADPGDLSVRIDRIEGALRQLTGTIEQLQYQNQQIADAAQAHAGRHRISLPAARLQGRTAAGRSAARDGAATRRSTRRRPPRPGNRGDVFDPAQNPNAPGAPRVLGNEAVAAPQQNVDNAPPVGAPGGRVPGAPLDLVDACRQSARAAERPGGECSAGGAVAIAAAARARRQCHRRSASHLAAVGDAEG